MFENIIKIYQKVIHFSILYSNSLINIIKNKKNYYKNG